MALLLNRGDVPAEVVVTAPDILNMLNQELSELASKLINSHLLLEHKLYDYYHLTLLAQ